MLPHRTRCTAALLALLPSVALAQTLSLNLVPTQYNGFNISCYGAKDGAIDLTVTGGTPPYQYVWSLMGFTTEDLSGLAAGYYRVDVTDAASNTATGDITLVEPEPIELRMEPYTYPNTYNVSCYNCYNGSIDITALGGVQPYGYLWNDGATAADRTGLGSGNHQFVMTDANGCEANSDVVFLSEPERNDWTMTGNAGTNPGTQYLGTTDNKDLVFKTNGAERLRLLATGELKSHSLSSGGGFALLGADSTGTLKLLTGSGNGFTEYVEGCQGEKPFPWLLCGNVLSPGHFLGSLNAQPVVFKTDATERMRITADGRVGIGTLPTAGPVGDYRLFVENGIACRDVLVKLGAWPDFVFAPEYELMSLGELRRYLRTNRHLPGIPSASEVAERGGVEVGDLQARMLKVVEEQALYILQLEEKLKEVEQRLQVVEASQR